MTRALKPKTKDVQMIGKVSNSIERRKETAVLRLTLPDHPSYGMAKCRLQSHTVCLLEAPWQAKRDLLRWLQWMGTWDPSASKRA